MKCGKTNVIENKNEIWKPIIGYEGYYEISNYGRVKSLSRPVYKKDGSFHRYKKETIKCPKLTTDGYLAITLSVNGDNKTFLIHRLVASAFIDKPDKNNEELEVNHKDLNRRNNYYENLEWISHKDNVVYSANLGQYYVHSGVNNGRCVSVNVYDDKWNLISSFQFLRQCAEWMMKNGYSRGKTVDGVVDGIKKSIDNNRTYFGFHILLN